MRLLSTKTIKDYKVIATDKEIGKVKGLYFDSSTWQAEFLKVKSGFWIFGQTRLLPIKHISAVQAENKIIATRLSSNEINEISLMITKTLRGTQNNINRDALLWMRTSTFGMPQIAPLTITSSSGEKDEAKSNSPEIRKLRRKNLWTLNQVKSYRVAASDGLIGKATNLIFDLQTSEIKYIMVEMDEQKIMLPPQWVSKIRPQEELISVKMRKSMVLSSPYALQPTAGP